MGRQKNPDQSLERKAKTSYDFQAVGNTTLKDINKQAEDYLVNLEGSVRNLDKAKKYFVDIHSTLTDITKDLESNDSRKCSSYLLSLENNLERFKAEFNKFLSSIEPPPRQLLYIAGLNKIKVIERYNSSLIDIKNYIKRLEEIEQEIAYSEIMQARPLNNTEFTNIYADVTQACARFQQTMRQESIVKAMRSRRARDRRALTGEAGNASRRKVICGRHGHELRRSECVPDAGRIAA
ncbi:hypothetical protein [Rickettsiella endosymbiont of Dermanyssus gallinae]|uniref:hypothetical protein n=1 Tax=Rickettsiella endosymbiont of Dermanyssus gallinae TaxID=2856608 RepID=UPI001C530CC7|nr:hypothetical protein [Rickettsiella endosymbiont of Dermanyssus gallinae]